LLLENLTGPLFKKKNMSEKLNFFVLKTVDIKTAGELKSFELKLPGSAKYCIGYQISATQHHDTLAIAKVGVSFNGGREDTIINDLLVRNPSNIRRRRIPLLQNIKLLQNAYVQGYVEDKGVVGLPYTIKIYFHLKRN